MIKEKVPHPPYTQARATTAAGAAAAASGKNMKPAYGVSSKKENLSHEPYKYTGKFEMWETCTQREGRENAGVVNPATQ